MGYFSNGTEGEMYYEQYCSRCIHEPKDADAPDAKFCPIWGWHLMENYEGCNNEKSYLHKLIPREDAGNGECVMFMERPADQELDLEVPPSTASTIRSERELAEYLKAQAA